MDTMARVVWFRSHPASCDEKIRRYNEERSKKLSLKVVNYLRKKDSIN
tara:strand:+ start:1780 stop:1923 length:144 start_codon:yes stop_codon:yes gene_type:complete